MRGEQTQPRAAVVGSGWGDTVSVTQAAILVCDFSISQNKVRRAVRERRRFQAEGIAPLKVWGLETEGVRRGTPSVPSREAQAGWEGGEGPSRRGAGSAAPALPSSPGRDFGQSRAGEAPQPRLC